MDAPQPLPQPENVPLPPVPILAQSQKSHKTLWIIVVVIAAFVCLATIVCGAVIGASAFKTVAEREPVETVLDAYMECMVDRNTQCAYDLFSPRAQRQVPISKLEEMVEGNNYILFEDYESLSLVNLNMSATVNTNQNIPQGTVANVTGILEYRDGIQGSFTAILEKVDGEWMIDGVYLTVPPGKFKD